MEFWSPGVGSPDPPDLRNPIFGFYLDKSAYPSLATLDSDGLAAYQPSLLCHKNEAPETEYNPVEVLSKAAKAQAATVTDRKERKAKRKREVDRRGYNLFTRERRPVLADSHAGLTYNEITRLLAESWESLPAIQRDQYAARAAESMTADSGESESDDDEDLGPRSAGPPPILSGIGDLLTRSGQSTFPVQIPLGMQHELMAILPTGIPPRAGEMAHGRGRQDAGGGRDGEAEEKESTGSGNRNRRSMPNDDS
jgi:hypothetical protein